MARPPLPALGELNRDFWQGGEAGELRIHRCQACRTWFHPPSGNCPSCLSDQVGAEATSGRATLAGYTINVQQWIPDLEVPFAVGIVELEEAPDVRLTTKLVDVPHEDLVVGMPLEVTFEHVEDIWLPHFRPAPTGRTP